ncbi:MAG: hypothetical protein H5T62_15855 [Anaerolineae bacterium]|nr:hypothetical protein [Anaerolineae bacterium]
MIHTNAAGPAVEDEQARREALYGLKGKFLTAYDTIVNPLSQFPIPIYTLRRWSPILGASGFWLLITFQQFCYLNSKQNWCRVDRNQLAQEAHLGTTTVHRYLHGEEYISHGLCHWVQIDSRSRRHRRQAGPPPTNHYTVILDAPLAPIDQRGLAQFLLERGAGPGVAASQIEGALEELTTYTLNDLLALCDEYAARFRPPPNWTENTFLPTAGDVVRSLGIVLPASEDERAAFLALCERVQQTFVNVKKAYLATNYFRHKWLPILGHKLALVVVQLRSRCFWSSKALRDEVSLHFTELARESDCSAKWLQRINQTQPLSREFFTIQSAGRRKKPTFKVTMLEPIAPQDQARYKALLRACSGDIDLTTERPELPRIGPAEVELMEAENGTAAQHETGKREPVVYTQAEDTGKRKPVVYTQAENTGKRKPVVYTQAENTGKREPVVYIQAENTGKRELVVYTETEKREPVVYTETEKGTGGLNEDREKGTGGLCAYSTLVCVSTSKRKALKQQKHPGSPAAATALLLDEFGIGAPSNERIIALNPDPTDVLAWMLYTITQPGLRKPADACGFVVNRLQERKPPPARFRLWAGLSPREWQALWRAHHYGGPYRAALPPPLARRFEAWEKDFAEVFPSGPFGEGILDPAALLRCLEKRLGPPPGRYEIGVEPDGIVIIPRTAEVVAWLEEHAGEIAHIWAELGVLHRVIIAALAEDPGAAAATEPFVSAQDRPLREVWQAALRELQHQMTRATFDTWLCHSRLISADNGACVVAVHNEYARQWLEQRLKSVIARTLAGVLGHQVEVQFVVNDQNPPDPG